jgi:hypothetical protein
LPDDTDFRVALAHVVREVDLGGAVFQGDTVDAVVRVVQILREDPRVAATLLGS